MKKIWLFTILIFVIVLVGYLITYWAKIMEQKSTKQLNAKKEFSLRTSAGEFILVKGGSFRNKKSNLYGKPAEIPDFYMGKYEVSQKEWNEIMEFNPSQFSGDNLPVETVSWYECIEYCNRRSVKEGLQPFYIIEKELIDPANISEFDSMKWSVFFNTEADGYRLPTEAEWEYAAGGGQMSKSFTYSGSDNIENVAWYWGNSGDEKLSGTWNWDIIMQNNNSTKPVGMKSPNELGIYDMSGNVREWCEDWYADRDIRTGYYRVHRGGGWFGGEHTCTPVHRGKFEASGKGTDQGFRLCRSR